MTSHANSKNLKPEMVHGAVKVVVGIAFSLVLGYCIYFDKVRHDDPQFREKLRERRMKKRERDLQLTKPPRNVEDRQLYFLEQISLGTSQL